MVWRFADSRVCLWFAAGEGTEDRGRNGKERSKCVSTKILSYQACVVTYLNPTGIGMLNKHDKRS